MPTLTMKSFSFGDAIDNLPLGGDSLCRCSIAKPRVLMPDPAFGALPPGRR